LLRSIHEIVATLMPAKNFYIALCEPDHGTASFPYFVDERDPDVPVGRVKIGRGLTAYVLRTGQPLLLQGREKFDEMIRRGEVVQQGAPSVCWLGVPLKTQEHTVGMLAAQ